MGFQLTNKAKNFIKKLDLKTRVDLKNPEVRKSLRKHARRHIGNVAVACVSLVFLAPAGGALDHNSTLAVNNEAAKTALNQALKVSRSKPALSLATAIVCLACPPVAGAAASPGMCVAFAINIMLYYTFTFNF